MMMMMMMSLAVTGWVDLCLSACDSDDLSFSPEPTDRQIQRREVPLVMVSGWQLL